MIIVTDLEKVLNMITLSYRYFCILASVVLLAGCGSSYQSLDNDEVHQNPSPDTYAYVDDTLTEQISLLEDNIKNFSKFFLFQDKEIKLPRRDGLVTDNYVLNRSVFIDWSGPIGQLLNDLSSLTGYKVQVIGSHPIIPPIVTLHHEHIKLLDVIRDVALQIHQKADLVVFPDEQLIELRYR
jgi:hypothetical protein